MTLDLELDFDLLLDHTITFVDTLEISMQVGQGIEEAPIDGKQYARKDGDWEEVVGGSSDVGAAIHAANVATVADADEFGFYQIIGAVLKKITWVNIKATLKTYFDSLYPSKNPAVASEVGTFTLALTHLDKVVQVNSGVACLCNIPANVDVAFPLYSVITIEQLGAGTVTMTALSGVTLNGGATTQGQYKFIQLYKSAINTWEAIGGV